MNGQIEREYREALDSLEFSNEAKERMMKNLMDEKRREPVKGKGFRPLRTGLIAAALCAALLGTAAAVQFFGVRVNLQGDPHWDRSNYTVSGGFAYFPVDSFSQEVRDMAAQEIHKSFLTWDELEQFMGWNLMDNPVLEAGGPGTTISSDKLEGKRTHIFMKSSINQQGQLLNLTIHDNYRMDEVLLTRIAVIYTDIAQEEFARIGYVPETVHFYRQGDQVSEEEYVTPSGLTASIVQVEHGYSEYTAHFSMNGVQCCITARYEGGFEKEDNSGQALAVLKQVLDGFQF